MHVAHDKQANLETYRRYIEQASSKGVKLLVFPECSLQGYTWGWDPVQHRFVNDDEQLRYFQENAETIPGQATEIMCKEAKKRDMYIQLGMAEKVDTPVGSRMFNSAVLVGPSGLIGSFRKVHMAPSAIFSSGDRFSVFDTELGKIGPVVCADIQYPESVRCLALDGAEVITNSTAWGMIGTDPAKDYQGYSYDLFTKANAMMNQVWMVHADQLGASTRSNHPCYGHSRIVDPMGRVVVDTGYNEGLALAKVDLKEELMRSRGRWFIGRHLLRDRHPEAYHALYKSIAQPIVASEREVIT